jgi:FKBP-type peptidyl-prolyl cis-trans isomerase 2
MTIQKNDFIEIEFTGRVKEGEVFDSNISEELKKLNSEAEAKPFIFSIGNGMFLEGVEKFLIGKEIGNYEIELKPENAFGLRNPNLIQKMPIKVFIEHKINPIPGAVFSFDNRIGKVLVVSGGRVMMDFNNPLAGKEVVYRVNVSKKIDNINEKVNALNDFFFKREFKFEIMENKLILEAEKTFKSFIELFKDKFKDILGLELEVKEIEQDKKQEN